MCSSRDAMTGLEQSEGQAEGAIAGRTAVRREVDVAIIGKSEPLTSVLRAAELLVALAPAHSPPVPRVTLPRVLTYHGTKANPFLPLSKTPPRWVTKLANSMRVDKKYAMSRRTVCAGRMPVSSSLASRRNTRRIEAPISSVTIAAKLINDDEFPYVY